MSEKTESLVGSAGIFGTRIMRAANGSSDMDMTEWV